MVRTPADSHRCPRVGCDRVISNTLFCCGPDWYKLSEEAKREIWRTSKLPSIAPQRRAAFERCYAEWAALDASGSL